MSSTRPILTGRQDSLGRPIRIGTDTGASRASAPPPPTDGPDQHQMSDGAIHRLLSKVEWATVDADLAHSSEEQFGDATTDHTYSFRITAKNTDGTYTVIDSSYGLVVMDNAVDAESASENHTTGSVDQITVCRDLDDPGGTELNTEFVYDEDRLAVLPTQGDDDSDAEWLERAGRAVRRHAAGRHAMYLEA